MSRKKLTDVENTDSFESFFVNDSGKVRQVSKKVFDDIETKISEIKNAMGRLSFSINESDGGLDICVNDPESESE